MSSSPPALFRFLSITFIFSCLLSGSSCKGKKAFDEETAQSAVDLRFSMGEVDEVIKDVNTVIQEQFTLRGRSSSQTPTTSVCGVKLDSLGQLSGKMTLTYNNTNCYGRIRTGKVRFTLEDYPLRKWKQKGCVLTIEYLGYKMTRLSDGRSVRMDGVLTLTNESGNTWFEMMYDNDHPPVSYVLTGNGLKLTFTDNRTALFNFHRRLNFSYSNNVTSCLVEGLSSQAYRSRVEAWGQTSEGDNFEAEVTSPYTWKTTCGAAAPLTGAVSIVVEGKDFDLRSRFGVDGSGNAFTGAGCPFGYEVTWNRKKKTNARLFGYY